jgi:hypothetical protein
MTTATVFTKDQAVEHLKFVIEDNRELFNRWLARGDGIAFYENKLIEDSQGNSTDNIPAMQFVSYGSPTAQIETVEPPQRMPDIGSKVNWRYHLIGLYKGEAL